MTTVDRLWFLAREARQTAAEAHHRLTTAHEGYRETTHETRVSRNRFRTLADRTERTGAPYGAHTMVYRGSGAVLLCRHEGVDRWVLPGGELETEESFREAAERELAEETGLTVTVDGLGLLSRVEFSCGEHHSWGVMPVFTSRLGGSRPTPTVADPEGEISDVRWFRDLPADTRDRGELRALRQFLLG